MLARALAATPWGIDARPVEVEVDVQNGLPQMQIVGLPDPSVRESRERVRAAIKNSGFDLPPRSVVINLAPADLRKEGNHLDLAIALALLCAHGHLGQDTLRDRLLCGELGLDGEIRSVRGSLAIADLAGRIAAREVLLPAVNAAEASALGGLPVIGLRSLAEAVDHVSARQRLDPTASAAPGIPPASAPAGDLADIQGQAAAKRALEIAAAGGHNLLLIGPPGSGKTMLAQRLPGLLPPLTRDEATAVTKVQSLIADQPPDGLVWRRPFRSPHPGTSTSGLIGGGPFSRPGEVSLAHTGVLFLDELPEFRRDTLEALRQPLEDGEVTIVRARARFVYPARFALLAAMNPCPCGHLGDPQHDCRCPLPLVERYRARVSGPLLDRIDLHIEVPALRLRDLHEARSARGASSAEVADRVARARAIQAARFGSDLELPVNAAMDTAALRRHARLDGPEQRLLDAAFEKLGLSARAMTRIVKVARTIADLAGSATLRAQHLAEAIQYRSLDRRLTG
jgi:magnesium chelatase family protein